jgi:hypothetical protein
MYLSKLLRCPQNQFVTLPFRSFGPKAKAGGAPAAAPYVPAKIQKTNYEILLEKNGVEAFMFGPPAGVEKMQNIHRKYIIPKLASRMEFFAKKMREQYIREAIYPDVKIFIDPLRER